MAGISPGLTRGALAVGLVAGLGGLVAYGVQRTPGPNAPAKAPLKSEAVSAVPDAQPMPEPAPAPEPTTAAAPPRFDVVRVAPDGAAVVAGRAEPGAKVTVSGDDGPLAEATADAAGEFVTVFRAPPGDAPQTLTLEAETIGRGTMASPDVVVLVPPSPVAAAGAATQGPPAQDGSAQGAAAADPPSAAQVAEAEARSAATAGAEAAAPSAGDAPEVAPSAPQVAATVVLRGEGAEATPTAPGAKPGGLTLASISYARTGLVTLAGIGAAGARIRAYVDERFARDGAVGADGRWTLELGDVAAGIYTLRIDALREDGTVASRIETPFQRDFPAAPGTGPDGTARPGSITVQPGNNLWTLARIHYGSGVLYTQIHTANRDLIRDPELIYPGQIFVLPEGAPAE